jgi:hypothetical protein
MWRLRSIPIALLLGVVSAAPMTAATPIGHWGHVGHYAIDDTAADPGAACRYDSAAGSHFLGSIRVGPIAMWGLRNELQQVGYRLMLQQRIGGAWTTVAVGPLRTAMAEKDVGNGVAGSTVNRDPERLPNGAHYRAVLRLLWFANDDLSVEGRVRVRIDHHRRSFDASQGAACRGQVPTGAGARQIAS